VIWSFLEFAVGAVIAATTLVDVFASILVPGPATSALRVVGRIRQFSLPIWRWLSSRGSGGRQRLSNSFAPLLFSLAFISWLLLLCLGFGLMLHACAQSFSPPLHGFGQALYVAGAYLLTVGTNEVQPHGALRALLLFGALAGFGVITATITFILEIQANLHEREKGVLKLTGLSGNPPSGIGLLETFASLRMQRNLDSFFREWADWSAAVMNSHVSFPVLVYFHSVGAECDWVVAMQVVLDAATYMMELTEDESAGAAAYMHRAGSRTASRLCDLFRLHPDSAQNLGAPELTEVVDRLRAAGYAVAPTDSNTLTTLIKLRADYVGRLRAIADHLGSQHLSILPEQPRNATG
jgi:hypothetical protein